MRELEMMEQGRIVDALRSATTIVFSTMLGLKVESGEPFVETKDPGPSQGIIGLVGLAGTWVGTVSVCCNAAMACRICSRMLGTEITEVGVEVLDAISEITNMIVGSFKTDTEVCLGPLGLSIPTVIYGLTFCARTACREQWIVAPFTCGDERIDVKISLKRNRGLPGPPITASGRLAYR